ncbi:S-layer homology domain-containing protein [Thermaerobacillus caldiproteolyticus]|uniref:S-layer homology domain-containing protein n=1 Tax=Thermaerobacillus caldiproteolyticus TaxID=247480 RepID=UPI00188AAC57|nr:S-layer homology domain-containing protein [Anoxybacillus caldiproteolyticus]QPA30757.1 S-layer homology domain-containing protein [Anoxybacillus caldiproteolyticus]
MAYQPKSYRKFLAGSVSAALVATAIGPVVANAASFSDVDPSDSHAADISALVEKGYIKGFEDGTFKPYSNVTRGQVAKIFARILKEQGFQVPADKKAFDDVPVDSKDQELVEAAAIVKAAGVMTGTDGKLNPSQNITRQQMAKVLVEAFKLTKPADFKSQITDLEKADAYARDYIQTLEANGVTVVKEFNPKGTVTRAAFASFVKRALDVQEAAKAPQVESVSAIGAKKLEVKFNKAVDDTKAKFEVKKGSITANIANVTFAADKKSAQIELTSKLTKGDYTVSVTGLTDTALTKTVTVEDEKVSKIEILSENAVLDASDASIVTVGYRVYNQYNEDITKTATSIVPTANVGATGTVTADASTGVITIDNDSNYKAGDKISLSLLDPATSTFTSKVLTVSDKATVADVAITGIYNEDKNAVLDTDATASDFHLLVTAKDQYGQDVPVSKIANDVVVTISDTSVIDVKGGAATPIFEQVTIDGKKQTVLELKAPSGGLKAGKATISIISKSTGKVAQYVVEVKEGVKADAVTLTAPELVVAGEKTEIPFSVLDLDGKEITKTSVLTGAKGVTLADNDANASVSFVQDAKTGKAKLVLDDTAGSTARKVIITATSATGKVATLVVDIKDKAEAKVITATKDVVTDLAVGGSFNLNKDNIVVKDQYGRTFDLTGKLAPKSPTATDAGKYLVKVEKVDTSADKVNLSTDTVIASDNANVTVTGAKKGSETIKLTLQKVDATGNVQNVASSELELNVKVAEKADIVSYELKDIDPIYDEEGTTATDAYTRDVVVYGVLADGKKVVVPASEYTVITGNNKLVYDSDTGKLNVPVKDGSNNAIDIVGTDGKDVPVNVKVIINAPNGPVILEKAVTVTKAAPKADKIELKSANGLTVSDSVVTGSVADVVDSSKLKGILKITDQYGEDISSSANITLTATNLVNSDNDGTVPSVTGNGTSTLTFTGVESGDAFNLTYVVDGKVVTVKVIVE